MNVEKDTERFTIKDEKESAEALYIADAENLRIEKLNTRVTMITILIPFLIVIILVVAYMDIKNRVISTQTSGSMGVQNLSKDLESRFSSLSLKQAKLEAQFSEQTENLKTSSAAIQVNVKKSTDRLEEKFKQISDTKADRKGLAALSKTQEKAATGLKEEMATLHEQMKDLNAAFTKFDEELASQILLMAKGFKKSQGRISKVENRTQKLETEKLSKEAMNLALGLERLSLQEMVKDRIREVNQKLTGLDRRIQALSRKSDEQTKIQPQGTKSSAPAKPAPLPESNASSPKIEEQTIQ